MSEVQFVILFLLLSFFKFDCTSFFMATTHAWQIVMYCAQQFECVWCLGLISGAHRLDAAESEVRNGSRSFGKLKLRWSSFTR